MTSIPSAPFLSDPHKQHFIDGQWCAGDSGARVDTFNPASGQRLIQRAVGYHTTMLRGQVTFQHGESTGALPGRLVRGAQRPR